VEHLVAGARTQLAWPLGQADGAVVALIGGEVAAPPVARRPLVVGGMEGGVTAVVAGEDHEGVIADTEFVQRVEEALEVAVDHLDAVGQLAAVGGVEVLIARHHGEVRLRMVEVHEERLLGRHRVAHPPFGLVQELQIDVLADLEVDWLDLL